MGKIRKELFHFRNSEEKKHVGKWKNIKYMENYLIEADGKIHHELLA